MKVIFKLTLGLAAISLMGCAKGFQNNDNETQLLDSSSGALGIADSSFMNMEYKGVAAASNVGVNQGQTLLVMDKPNQSVILILPIPAAVLQVFGPLTQIYKDIPELPGAKIIPYNNQIAVSVPLKYIVHKSEFQDGASTLPSGDPLPRFPDGEGADIAIKIANAHVAHIYIGVSAAAVFVEMPELKELSCIEIHGYPVCPPAMLGPYAIKNEAKTDVLGYFALIAAKPQFNGGVYIASIFPPEMARFIDQHVKF